MRRTRIRVRVEGVVCVVMCSDVRRCDVRVQATDPTPDPHTPVLPWADEYNP
jgi:hypothetical protein